MRLYACFVALCCVVSMCSGQEKCCINHDIYTIDGEYVTGWYADIHNLTFEKSLSKRVYDYTQSRFYVNNTILGTHIKQTLKIRDFNQNLTWTINPVAQTCQRTYLPMGTRLPRRCIPGRAQYRDQVNYPGDVLVNNWRFDVNTKRLNGEVSRGYTIDGCLPTRGSFVGTEDINGAPAEALVLQNFNNFQVLTDVSDYFNLPSYC